MSILVANPDVLELFFSAQVAVVLLSLFYLVTYVLWTVCMVITWLLAFCSFRKALLVTARTKVLGLHELCILLKVISIASVELRKLGARGDALLRHLRSRLEPLKKLLAVQRPCSWGLTVLSHHDICELLEVPVVGLVPKFLFQQLFWIHGLSYSFSVTPFLLFEFVHLL